MRSDIVPGGVFPDYALPDHTGKVRTLSELQGRSSRTPAALSSRTWHDLRAATREIRPDWDLAKPGLRAAWDAGELSPFHGWDRR